jgi:hypothetical protein
MPPSNVSDFMDAFHDGEEVRFCRLDNVVGEAEVPSLVTHLLNDQELLLMSAEETVTFAVEEKDTSWRKAMLEEMRSIEENRT